MRTPLLWMAAERLLEIALILISRLMANPVLIEILQFFQPAVVSLQEKHDEHSRAEQRTANARDRLHELVDELEAKVQTFAHTLKQIAHNHFNSHIYRTYLPGGMTAVDRGSIPEKIERTQQILGQLDEETNPRLKAQAPELAAAVAAVIEADRAYAAAIEAERVASAVLLAEKRRFIVSYRKTYNMLRLHFEDDPKRAEEYFPDLYHTLKGEAASEEPEAGDAGSDTEGEADAAALTTTTATTTTAAAPSPTPGSSPATSNS